MDISMVVASVGVGACFAAVGLVMMKTGNASLLHSYHYATTPAADRPLLARETGAGLVAMGLGVALLGLSQLLPALAFVGAVLLASGIVWALLSIVRRNGSLMSVVPCGRGARGAGTTAATVLVAAALFAACAVPGVSMAVSGDPSLLHSYHLANVAAADLPALARWEGAAMVLLGAGLALVALAGLLRSGSAARRPAILLATGLVVVGLILTLGVVVWFNGTLVA